MPFDKIVRRVTEPLYEDEKLRSNLTDDEARVVLGWAAQWIEMQVISAKGEPSAEQTAQRALARVQPVISAINALAAQPGELRLADAVVALEPFLEGNQKLSRSQVFELLTNFASAAWRVQSERARGNR
jgi:hypothetical protein